MVAARPVGSGVSGRERANGALDRLRRAALAAARARKSERMVERPPSSTGNRAFDEYRAETLRRLEEEQREFKEFLDRLRHAKDKAEFDDFMAERGRRPQAPPPQPGN